MKVAGFLFLLAFFGMAISLVVMLIAFIAFGQARNSHLFPFTIVEDYHARWIYISAFVTAFIPVMVIILLLISGIFGSRSINRSSATTLLIVWLIGLCMFIYYAVDTASHFRSKGSFTETIKLKATPDNVYHLTLNDVKYLTHEDSLRLNVNDQFHGFIIKNNDYDDSEPRNVFIKVVQSDTNQPELTEEFAAQGPNETEALMNARNTSYQFIQKDSILQFDSRLIRTNGYYWRCQEVYLTLKLPLNAKVIVDEDLNDHVDMNGLSVPDCKGENKKENATSALFVITNDGAQCKVDTLVTVLTPKQKDSIRNSRDAQEIAKYRAQIDSIKQADSIKAN